MLLWINEETGFYLDLLTSQSAIALFHKFQAALSWLLKVSSLSVRLCNFLESHLVCKVKFVLKLEPKPG
ncbi:hypothetical protein L596_017873 [Steinernema carpocapsae]|uniref:Uncharacterized protein n=1 Tax=Steinernema carpocapsae TaxID=34508 RepID=A0A4U5N2Y6_STECR|nr:hypothetical protein L596_017873 [Steinernema carpocapsae]